MFIVYFLPFIFLYLPSPPYSYGPTGFDFSGDTYLLYCGVSAHMVPQEDDPNNSYYWLTFGSVYIFPVLLFFTHTILLLYVNRKIKSLHDRNYLNSKQKFLIHTGRLSYIVYLIQGVNLFKTLLIGILSKWNSDSVHFIIIIINYIFDLYPFTLLFFYCRYLGRSKDEKFHN